MTRSTPDFRHTELRDLPITSLTSSDYSTSSPSATISTNAPTALQADLTPSFVIPAQITTVHPQLRDLIVCPAERGRLYYVKGKGVCETVANVGGREEEEERGKLRQGGGGGVYMPKPGYPSLWWSTRRTPYLKPPPSHSLTTDFPHPLDRLDTPHTSSSYSSHYPSSVTRSNPALYAGGRCETKPWSVTMTLPHTSINNSFLLLPTYTGNTPLPTRPPSPVAGHRRMTGFTSIVPTASGSVTTGGEGGLGIATYPNTLPTGPSPPGRSPMGMADDEAMLGDDGGAHSYMGSGGSGGGPSRGVGGTGSMDDRIDWPERRRLQERENVRLRQRLLSRARYLASTERRDNPSNPHLPIRRGLYDLADELQEDDPLERLEDLDMEGAEESRRDEVLQLGIERAFDRAREVDRLQSMTRSMRARTSALQAATERLYERTRARNSYSSRIGGNVIEGEREDSPAYPGVGMTGSNAAAGSGNEDWMRDPAALPPWISPHDYGAQRMWFQNEADRQRDRGTFWTASPSEMGGPSGSGGGEGRNRSMRDEDAAAHVRRRIATRPRSRMASLEYEDTVTPIRDDEPRLLISNNDMSVKLFAIRQAKTSGSSGSRRWGELEPKSAPRKLAKIGGTKFDTAVNHTSISPDGRTMLVVGDTNDVFLYNVKSGGRDFEKIAKYKGSNDAGFSTSWSKDGRKFVVASQDGQVTVWDHRSSKPLATLFTSPISRRSSAYGRDPYWDTFDSSDEGLMSTGDISPGTSPQSVVGMGVRSTAGGLRRDPARVVKFSPVGSSRDLLVFSEEMNNIHIVDARTFDTQISLPVPLISPITAEAVSPTDMNHVRKGTNNSRVGLAGLCFDQTGDWLYAGTESSLVEYDLRLVGKRGCGSMEIM